MKVDYIKLSKKISHALRHAARKYKLELDENGWGDINQLLKSLKCNKNWENLTYEDIEYTVKNSKKKRFEISNNKIRALYGHSRIYKVVKEEKKPPDILYHGTAKRFIENIKEKGLHPMKRQFVHLSVDKETAFQVGKRRDKEPVILIIDAKRAWEDEIKFYEGNDQIWLVDYIDSKYIIWAGKR